MSHVAPVPGARAQPIARLLLGAIALLFSIWACVTFIPGYIVADEVAYDWAARAFNSGSGVDLGNAYADLQSPELQQPHARSILVAEGRLVSKYPSGFPLLASLFYTSTGGRALGLLNALSLPGILLATWLVGRRLLRSEWLALFAVLLMIGATFAVPYGRDVWPHSTTLALVMASTAALMPALDDSVAWRSRVACPVVAGVFAGLALNARVDAMLYVAALGVALLLRRPLSLAAPTAFGLGTLPGIAGLAVDNYCKWGAFYPLAYSPDVGAEIKYSSQFLPVCGLGMASVALWQAWGLPQMRRLRARAKASPRAAWFILASASAALLAIPAVRYAASSWARGTYSLLFALSSVTVELGGRVTRERTELGSYVFSDGIRTGVFQDCPHLILAALPFLTRGRRLRPCWLVVVVPSLFLPLAFGWSSWQGGGGASLRYFLPLLPLGSIAVVAALVDLKPRYWPSLTRASLLLGATLSALVWWTLLRLPRASYVVELARSPVSTGLALSMVIFVLLRGLGTRRLRRWSRTPSAFLVGVSLMWSVASCHGYVSQLSQRQRAVSASMAGLIQRIATPNALLFLDYPAPTASTVTVAYPGVDDAADAWRLILLFRSRGQRIFGIMDRAHWDTLMNRPEARGGLLRLASADSVVIAEVLPDGMPPQARPPRTDSASATPIPAANRSPK